MRYLTYEEYEKIGGTLDEAAFNRYIDRACSVIDNVTHNRIDAMNEIPVPAKALCRDLCEYIERNIDSEGTITSKSQSAGGVSESESYTVKTKEDIAQDMDSLVCDYLLSVRDDKGTPLLYRGCVG